jgi:CRP/FNR family nitrogen fixation transcriptional regulator
MNLSISESQLASHSNAHLLPQLRNDAEILTGHPSTSGVQFCYRPDEEIYGEAEPAEFVYKLVSGAVRSYKLLPDGRRQIAAFHLEGDIFGIESSGAHQLTAEAVVDTKAILLRRSALETLAGRDVQIAYRLWTAATESLRCAEARMLLMGRKTALERVASFLIELDDRSGKTGFLDLVMSRRDIADYLGLTLETVSRAISQMRSSGALVLEGARHVKMKRRELLALMEN